MKGKNNSNKKNDALKKAAQFFNTHRDFIYDISLRTLYNDEPQLFLYATKFTNHAVNTKEFSYAGGSSFDERIALMRTLGEGIERYCLTNYKPSIVAHASIKNLKKPYLNPHDMSPLSSNQLTKPEFKRFKFSDNTKFHWTKGISLTTGDEVLLPAQLVSFFPDFPEEPLILEGLSTGAAAGASLKDALYRAICEVVERDSYMISYLNKLPSPKVDLTAINDEKIKEILKIFKRYNFELIVLDLTTDLEIPSYAAIALDRTGLGPAVSIGLKAGFEHNSVIIGAIEESLLTSSWIRDMFTLQKMSFDSKKPIKTLDDRAAFWFPQEMIAKLDFWLEQNKSKVIEIDNAQSPTLENIMAIFKKKKIEVIYVDITDETVRKNGFSVARVIIPDLMPLYLDETCAYLGKKRLYETPVVMGMVDKPKREHEINTVPHPFL